MWWWNKDADSQHEKHVHLAAPGGEKRLHFIYFYWTSPELDRFFVVVFPLCITVKTSSDYGAIHYCMVPGGLDLIQLKSVLPGTSNVWARYLWIGPTSECLMRQAFSASVSQLKYVCRVTRITGRHYFSRSERTRASSGLSFEHKKVLRGACCVWNEWIVTSRSIL